MIDAFNYANDLVLMLSCLIAIQYYPDNSREHETNF